MNAVLLHLTCIHFLKDGLGSGSKSIETEHFAEKSNQKLGTFRITAKSFPLKCLFCKQHCVMFIKYAAAAVSNRALIGVPNNNTTSYQNDFK